MNRYVQCSRYNLLHTEIQRQNKNKEYITMNKYTRRRMVAWSALLAVIGVGGLGIVKNKSDNL